MLVADYALGKHHTAMRTEIICLFNFLPALWTNKFVAGTSLTLTSDFVIALQSFLVNLIETDAFYKTASQQRGKTKSMF
jgi:hypothetical protein